MKRITKYIGLALAVSTFAVACNKNAEPVFNDKDAFVAFDKVSLSVAEDYSKDGKTFKVPVTLASVKGFEETLKFVVTEPAKNGAKAGVNYELVTTSGVLSFDAENRTAYIEFKTKTDDTFTGDLKLEIEIFGNEEVTVGSENICTLTINDIDHPLGFMLGDYTMTGNDVETGVSTWNMTISKDEEDITKVWFHNLTNWNLPDLDFYGIVNNEKTIINIPFGQSSKKKNSAGETLNLYGCDFQYVKETGSLEVTINKDEAGNVLGLDFGNESGFAVGTKPSSLYNIIFPGITAVKN